MRKLLALLAVVLLVAAAAGCGSDDDDEETGSPTGTEAGSEPGEDDTEPPVTLEGEVDDHGTEDLSGEDDATLELEADDFYFAPTFVKGEPGGTITVQVTNEGDAPHTFTIDDQEIDEEVQAGESAEAEVTVPEDGAIRFYCRFHTAGGMQGAVFTKEGAEVSGGEATADTGAGVGY